MALARAIFMTGRVLLLVVGLGAVFAASAALGLRLALQSREVPVPALIGQTVAEATTTVAADGLTLRVDASRREHPGVGEDRVAQQDPEPGASTRRPRAVRVWLKAPERATLAPDLVGRTARTARITTDELRLTLDTVTLPDPRPAGTVLAQWPAPGAAADQVRLAVSAGPQALPIRLPDFTGQAEALVVAQLRDAGFRPVTVPRRHPPGMPADLVAGQTPAPGSPATPPDTITLEVWK